MAKQRTRMAVDPRTRALCAEFVRASGDEPLRYRLLAPIARASSLGNFEAEAAVIDAVRRGWLMAKGEPPHSIALTDGGWRMVATWLRRRLRG
jgi:hypothetical protein